MDRRRRGCLVAGLFIWMVIGSCSSEAQFSANYQTNIISGPVASNWPGNYIVGSNTFADVVLVQNGGRLIQFTGDGILGYASVGSNNSALVSGGGSFWTNSHNLFVGGSGGNNSLTISDGGVVFSRNGCVGSNATATGNSVVVAGSNSVWRVADSLGGAVSSNDLVLSVGHSGAGNSLVISNGASVRGFASVVGFNAGSSNNTVLVTGPGSVWSNLSMLVLVGAGPVPVGVTYVGRFGAGNALEISHGGLTRDVAGFVGYGVSSSNNTVRVTDEGVWSNVTLTVGRQGSGNSLVVDGGTVVATNLLIGADSVTCDNVVQLESGTIIATNAAGTGAVDVQHGTFILHGGVLQTDKLVMTNPCASFVHTGGAAIIGNVVLDPNTFRITSITPQDTDVLVTWMMGPGATNTLQATAGDAAGGYSTNGFTDIFIVTNNTTVGTITNYLDIGAATNVPARYYRARLAL